MPAEQLPLFQREQLALTGWLRQPELCPMPGGMEPRRLHVYRELFFNNVAGFVENAFPLLQRLLPPALWGSLVQGFFADHRCHTPYFHGIAAEFLAYLDGCDQPGLAAFSWVRELAHFEWAELAADIVETAEPPAVDADGDLLDGIPVVTAAAWPLVYRWPVHRFAAAGIPEQVPDQPSCLLVYRTADHIVQMREVAPLTARLVETLQTQPGRTGRAVLTTLAAQAGHADPVAFVAAGAGILAELQAAGVIPGTRL